MATIIQIKRSTGANAPSTSTLAEAELAYTQDKSNDGANSILYIESVDSGESPVIHKVGGKYYTDIIDQASSTNSNNTLIKRDATGSFSANVITADTFIGNVTFSGEAVSAGIADSANTLTTPRNITLSGDLQGNVFFDGSEDVTIVANVISNSVTLGTDTSGDYVQSISGASGNITISGGTGEGSTPTVDLTNSGVTASTYGGTSSIPVIVVDEKGRITSAANAAVSIATTLDIAGDTGTNTLSLSTDTLTIDGALPGISTSVTGSTVTITNTGVTSIAGTSGNIAASGSTGSVTLSLVDTSVTPGSYGGASAPEYIVPSITVDAKGRITSSSNNTLNLNAIGASLIPSADATYDLGSNDNRWNTLFVSGSTIVLGNIALQDNNGTLEVSAVDANGAVIGGSNEALASNTYVDSELLLKANVVDLTLEVAGDSGSSSFDLYANTFSVVGDGSGGISTSLTGNTLTVTNLGVKEITTSGHAISASVATGNVELSFGGVGNLYSTGHGIETSADTGNIALTFTGVGAIATSGHAIQASGTTGNITLSFGGVGNVFGTANEIEVSASTGNVQIGLPQDVTVSRDLTINRDLSVSGNLYVLGTATTINTQDFTVDDPLIHLANTNTSSDLVDIGFEGHYFDATFGNRHAGLFRDASDSGKFKLFANVSAELEGVTTIDTSDPGFTVATLIANLEGGTVSGLAQAIAVADGGLGRTTLTANAVLYGDGTNQVGLATGSAGEVLQISAGGAPIFAGIDGGTF